MKLAIALPLSIVLSASVLAAQQPDSTRPMMHPRQGMGQGQGMGPGMGQGMGPGMMNQMPGPMIRGMVFFPGNLLDHKDQLGLTEQQITRIKAIADAAQQAHEAAQTEAMRHMQQLGQVLNGAAPDTAEARKHFMGHLDAMERAHWAMLRAALQAKAVLTAEQRSRVDGWADAMQMHQGAGPHGPAGQPPMEHPGRRP